MNMNRPIVFVMCGLSASGKSSYAKELSKEYNAVILSSDDIRKSLLGDVADMTGNGLVFDAMHRAMIHLLKQNRNVILDATHLTIKDRKKVLTQLKPFDVEKSVVVVLKDFEKCKIDNIYRVNAVPNIVLNKQIRRFQIPSKNEGWDNLLIYCKEENKGKNLDINKEKGFNQHNSHHSLDLYEHSKAAMEYILDKNNCLGIIGEAALFHDYGKLFTQSFDEYGEAHYYNHENVGAYLYAAANPDYIGLATAFYINYHMMLYNPQLSEEKLKEMFGEITLPFLKMLHEADISAH